MSGKSPTQRIEDLEDRVRDLEATTERDHAVMELRLRTLESHDAERTRIEEELRNKVAELTAKNAMLEERARHQEKTSDRGWQLWLAVLGFSFGLISLLLTAGLQIKK